MQQTYKVTFKFVKVEYNSTHFCISMKWEKINKKIKKIPSQYNEYKSEHFFCCFIFVCKVERQFYDSSTLTMCLL